MTNTEKNKIIDDAVVFIENGHTPLNSPLTSIDMILALKQVKLFAIPDVMGMFNEGFTINIKPHPYLQKRGEATLLVHPEDMPK